MSSKMSRNSTKYSQYTATASRNLENSEREIHIVKTEILFVYCVNKSTLKFSVSYNFIFNDSEICIGA